MKKPNLVNMLLRSIACRSSYSCILNFWILNVVSFTILMIDFFGLEIHQSDPTLEFKPILTPGVTEESDSDEESSHDIHVYSVLFGQHRLYTNSE